MPNRFICRILNLPSEVEGHSHSHAHIFIPLSGSATFSDGGEPCTVLPGSMSFVLPYTYHTWSGSGQNEIIVMNIPESMVKKSDHVAFAANRVVSIPENIRPLVELIRDEIQEDPDSDAIRYLFYYFYDKFISRKSCKSVEYVRDHFAEDVSVEELARIENYNRFYYSSWFKGKTGLLPSEYLQQVRIEHAKALLEHTCYRIQEIAIQVGYDSASAFTRAFKKSESVAPREYRRRIQNY